MEYFLSILKAECAHVLCSPLNASAYSGSLSPGCSVGIPRGSTLLKDTTDSGGLASEPDSLILCVTRATDSHSDRQDLQKGINLSQILVLQ